MKKLFTILALLMAFTVSGVAQDTWTVAGSLEDIFGTTWDPENTANDMTLSGDVYVFAKNVKFSSEVECLFKVCNNHGWTVAYPESGDYYLKIPAGSWEVVFMFDPTTQNVCAVYKAQLLGDWNWDVSQSNLTLTRDKDKGAVWTGVLDLKDVLADQKFKLVLNNGETWLGVNGLTINAPEGWVDKTTDTGEGKNYNFILENEESGYETYDITATWKGSWTLTIAGKDERTITTPGTPVWTGASSTYCTDIVVDASQFANAKVGDVLHIVIENANQKSIYNSQVQILNGEGKLLEGGINVGMQPDGTLVDFVLTGDILSQLKANGLKLGGYTYSSKLITVETTTTTGSENSIWLGSQNTNISAIDLVHFKNANDFAGIKAGDVIRITYDDKATWMRPCYISGDSWTWTEFTAGELEVFNNYWDSYVDLLVKSEDGAAILNNTTDNHGFVINVGDDAHNITQVEIIPSDGNYYIFYDGGDGQYQKGEKMTESEGVYSGSVSGAKYFAIVPNTALNEAGDGIGYWFTVVRPAADYNFLVEFQNYSDNTVLNNGKVWQVSEDNTSAIIEISYTPADGSYTIVNKEEFTISQYGYSTYSRAQKYKVEGATANFVTVSGSEATLVPQADGAVLPAMTGAGKGAGIIISGDAGATAYICSAYADAETVDNSANLLAGSGDNEYNIGTQFADGDPYTAYIFAKPEGKEVGFYLLDTTLGATLAAHKAFLAVPGASSAPFFGFADGEGTTGIGLTPTLSQGEGVWYDLSGRRVEKPTKGLYIVNGKKVLVP